MPGGPLTQLLIKPSSADCNLRCVYCFYLEKGALYPQQRTHRMSNEVLREMVRQMMSRRLPQVGFSWQGGEPTLLGLDFFRRTVEYQQQFGHSGQVVANSLQTNGILINDEWSQFFAQYHFLIGLSLDGPPDVHDRYRLSANGRGSHAHALRAMRSMRKHGVEFNILAVVNDFSVRHAKRIYQYLREQDLGFLQFISCVERDPQTGGPAPFSVSPEAYGDFLCTVFDEWVRDFRDGLPMVSERTFDGLLHTYLGEPSPTCVFMETCGDYVVVEHSGDVYSCDFFVEPSCYLGNLLERDLHLLAASPKQVAFGERKCDLPPECQSCRWLRHCHGGCPKDRQVVAATQGCNYLCPAYKRFFAHSEATFIELRDRWLAQMAPAQGSVEPSSPEPSVTPPSPPPAVEGSVGQRVGRNDPCPCGSGKKFKKCCLRKETESRAVPP